MPPHAWPDQKNHIDSLIKAIFNGTVAQMTNSVYALKQRCDLYPLCMDVIWVGRGVGL